MRRRGRVWAHFHWTGLILLLGLLAVNTVAQAAELIKVDAKGPVDIRADRVNFDERTKMYLAEGEVEIVRGTHRINADRCLLHSETLIAEAEGRVRLTSPGDIITGERMLVDLQGGTGKVYNGMIFVKPSHYYLRGEEIEKTGRDTYRLHRGSFTTCDGSEPAWAIQGRDMEVSIEGYGTAWDPTFRIRDFPVFWAPYMAFPAKFQRQSGLLPPMFGYTDNDGVIFNQPWFQTLGDSQDATLTLNYMSRRGLDYGLEYRWAGDRTSKGMMMVDYLPSDAMGQTLKDQLKNSDAYGSRYWFRGKADQLLFGDTVMLKADLDLVSDRDYMREFAFGYSGFESSNNRFDQMFGRMMDTRGSMVRTNQINLQRYWSNATLNASGIYYDDLTNNNKNTLQYLPTITYAATRQAVGETGLYFQMDSGYTYYYREEGSRGQIANISPTVSLPLNFNDYLELESGFTWQQRFFDVTRDSTDDRGATTTGATDLWSHYTTASTYLYRVFEMGSPEDPLKIKHAMRPNITYSYQPAISEGAIASLAKISQSRYNSISYGVDNTLTSKKMGRDEDTGEVRSIYREFLKFALTHSFNIDEYRSSLGMGDTQPWGLFGSKVQVYTSRYFFAQADASWNPYHNSLYSLNSYVKTQDRRGDSITFDYLYTEDWIKQISGRLKLALSKEWFVAYTNHKDLNTNVDYRSVYEVGYETQCWGVRAFYTDDEEQRGFYVAFSVGGFGELLGWGRISERTGSY